MAGAIRLEYHGAVCHLMAQWDQGQAIFTDHLDCKIWLKTLGQACEKTGGRIHAWVMMSNQRQNLLAGAANYKRSQRCRPP